MDEDIVAILMFGLVVFVPVAGLTMRFALKPLVDSLIRIAEMRRSNQEVQLLERRVALLEKELGALRGEVGELGEQKEFYRRLTEPTVP